MEVFLDSSVGDSVRLLSDLLRSLEKEGTFLRGRVSLLARGRLDITYWGGEVLDTVHYSNKGMHTPRNINQVAK